MGLSLSKEGFKRHPRESAAVIWVIYVFARLTRSLLSKKNKDGESETIKMRALDGKKKTFTKTDGGFVDLGWTGAVEFWFPSIIQTIECIMIARMGSGFFKTDPNSGIGPWQRFRNLAWAAFCLLPMLDLVVPHDWANPRNEDQKHKRFDPKFRLPLYVWAIIEVFATYKGIEAITRPGSKVTKLEAAGIIGTMAIYNGGVGINTSHELLHKPSYFEKFLGYVLLTNVNYNHWGEEHLSGHHENVATPLDPASSRLNESVYAFLPRTYIGSWVSAWNLEKRRLVENRLHPIFNNRMILNTLLPLAWAGFIAKSTGGGLNAIKVFYLQGFLAASLLEFVNYVEHYGLSREKLPDGSYEPVNPTHSWNAPHPMSNAFLYKLQRHSDHHTYAMRPYQLLRNFAESPQLPTGYPGMILLACFPPIYRWIMNPLVQAAKVKPENYKEDGFQKDSAWIEAERIAKWKVTAFSTLFSGIGTWLLMRSERDRIRSLRATHVQ